VRPHLEDLNMRDYRNSLIGFLALTTVAAGYWAWSESVELRKLKSATPATPSIAESRREAWQANREAKSASTSTVQSAASEDAPATVGSELQQVDARMQNTFSKLMENPEFVRLFYTQQRASLDGRYAALFKQLGLSDEQLEQFKNLLVEKQSAMIDIFTAARAQGFDPRTDRDTLRELARGAARDVDATIRANLSESAYAAYEQFEQTVPQRNMVDKLDARLSYSPNPLTTAQAEQMVRILKETTPPSTGRNDGLGNMGGGTVEITDAAIARAQGILTPAQHTALVQLQSEQTAAKELRQLRQDSRRPNAGNASTAAK
jgi:hypothetical protein